MEFVYGFILAILCVAPVFAHWVNKEDGYKKTIRDTQEDAMIFHDRAVKWHAKYMEVNADLIEARNQLSIQGNELVKYKQMYADEVQKRVELLDRLDDNI